MTGREYLLAFASVAVELAKNDKLKLDREFKVSSVAAGLKPPPGPKPPPGIVLREIRLVFDLPEHQRGPQDT